MYERQKGVGSTSVGIAEAMSEQRASVPVGAASAMGRTVAKKAENRGIEGILEQISRNK